MAKTISRLSVCVVLELVKSSKLLPRTLTSATVWVVTVLFVEVERSRRVEFETLNTEVLKTRWSVFVVVTALLSSSTTPR